MVKFMKKYYAGLALIFFNLIPLLGVIYWDWKLFDILFLYWLESLVIVIYNGFKIHKVAKINQYPQPSYFVYGYIYFMLSGFWLIIICVFFGPLKSTFFELPGEALDLGVIFPLIGLIISHGISYKNNFLDNKEYRNLTVNQVFYAPIFRYSIIQLVVFFTGIGYLITDSIFFGAITMVVLKTILDLFAHWQEHRTRAKLIDIYTNEEIDKIYKRTRLIGYILVFGPLLIIPLTMIIDPYSNYFIKKGSFLFQILDTIFSGLAYLFIIWALILLPIGGIILSKNIRHK